MRTNIVILGVLVSGMGLALTYFQGAGFFATPAGLVNIVLGIRTSRPPGVTINPAGPVRMLVDRGVVRTSIYQLAFLDRKLVMKRLASANVTVIIVFILALIGLVFDGFLGALAGGITAYSLQEYLTQKNRDRIDLSTILGPTGRGDQEIPYAKLSQVRLKGNRLLLSVENKAVNVSLPKGHVEKIRSALPRILPGKYQESD